MVGQLTNVLKEARGNQISIISILSHNADRFSDDNLYRKLTTMLFPLLPSTGGLLFSLF